MRKLTFAALGACLLAAGCETTDGGSGYLTHSSHSLTASDRTIVEARMNSYLKIPASVSGLKSSYRLADGAVAVCGYVSSLNQPSIPPALFAGTLQPSGSFVPLSVKGKGQDPQRIATVRAFCAAEQISI